MTRSQYTAAIMADVANDRIYCNHDSNADSDATVLVIEVSGWWNTTGEISSVGYSNLLMRNTILYRISRSNHVWNDIG